MTSTSTKDQKYRKQLSEDQKVLKPYTIWGHTISEANIRRTLNAIANLPDKFASSELVREIFHDQPERTYHDRQEALNRLMQRLRKAGLANYDKKKWTVSTKQWQRIQDAMTMSYT